MKTGILLMAQGSPDSVARMGDFLRHVLPPKPPTPEIIAELHDRYRQIGGKRPLLDILRRPQAEALELTWDRLPMSNADPLLIEALAPAARKVL